MNLNITLALIAFIASANAFTVAPSKTAFCTKLNGSKDAGEVTLQRAFTTNTLVEFGEKKRVHVGKITSVEHKSNGGARYEVEDHDGHKFQIADKAINYAMKIAPDEERKIKQIFDQFAAVLVEPEMELRKDLDISPELLEMAWEEALESDSHELTALSLIDLVHSHTATGIEAYKAWRLMKTDMAHVFFKELKDHGRVVAFKAKAEKTVKAAKDTFCRNAANADDEFCWV